MEDYYDPKLITEFLAGREKSWGTLVKRHLKSVYGFIYRYVRSQQDAEDITQETFVKMWHHIKRFDRQQNFKTWLFTIAKNTALDFLKRKRAIPFADFENEYGENIITETLADPAISIYELLQKQGITKTIKLTVAKLSSKYQEVLNYRYDHDLTFAQIAESLGQPLHTVKSRHRRALIMVKKNLAES